MPCQYRFESVIQFLSPDPLFPKNKVQTECFDEISFILKMSNRFLGCVSLLWAESKKNGELRWFTVQNVELKTKMTLWSALNATNRWVVNQLLDGKGDEKRTNASGYPTADQSPV